MTLHGIEKSDYAYRRRSGNFQHTQSASLQRLYRSIVADGLKGCENVVMSRMLNLWFRHQHGNSPLAISVKQMAEWSKWSVRRVTWAFQRLIDRGFLVVAHGGLGRGKVRNFAVDLTAIREALAPDIIEEDKRCNSEGTYNKELMICRKHWWNAGLWGRDHHFRRGFVRALLADMNATWRFMVHRSLKLDALPSLSPHSMRAEASFNPTTGECYA